MIKNNENLHLDNEDCLECGNKNLFKDAFRGEIVCNICGTVINSKLLDYGHEWRAFNSYEDHKKSRVGAPTSLSIHDRGLSTIISRENKDIYGKFLSPNMKAQIHRLRM